MRNNNIQSELCSILKEIKILDEDLLKPITEVVANETELNEKLIIKKGYSDK